MKTLAHSLGTYMITSAISSETSVKKQRHALQEFMHEICYTLYRNFFENIGTLLKNLYDNVGKLFWNLCKNNGTLFRNLLEISGALYRNFMKTTVHFSGT
jgi:hypothetical protein